MDSSMSLVETFRFVLFELDEFDDAPDRCRWWWW